LLSGSKFTFYERLLAELICYIICRVTDGVGWAQGASRIHRLIDYIFVRISEYISFIGGG
jgi:hypothetical protein